LRVTWLADRVVEGRHNWLRLPECRPGLGNVVDFLADQVATGGIVLHGSNLRSIERFEPRNQTTYHGGMVRAVFATTDPVWPLFFAVTSTAAVGSRWNACVHPERSGAERSRYFFSVGAADDGFWTNGAVYLLPRTDFRPSDEPSEWIAVDAVMPLEVVPVTPADFPFRDRVFRHVEGESEWRLETRLVLESIQARLRRGGAAGSTRSVPREDQDLAQ
jgi:hypothetical protein